MRPPELMRSILVFFLWLSATSCTASFPQPNPITQTIPVNPATPTGTNALLAEIIARVSSDQLFASIGDLSGEWPVTIGGEPYTLASRVHLNGDSILRATQYVYEHLGAPGLAVEYFEWQLPAGAVTKGRNVVVSLPGSASPGEIVLMTAHVDDMVDKDIDPDGIAKTRPPIPVVDPLWNKYPAPGADDNASGTVGVLLGAQILSGYRFERTVRFVFFTGEENGYLGSYAYASAMRKAGENIIAVLNLDMLAYDRAGGPLVDLNMRSPGDSPQDGPLADVFLQVVRVYRVDLIPKRQYQPASTSAAITACSGLRAIRPYPSWKTAATISIPTSIRNTNAWNT